MCLFYLFIHALGLKTINNGNISNLPISIAKIKAILERGEYPPKFSIGPTFPNPGPTLFIHAATAVIFVLKSNPSIDIIKTNIIYIIINTINKSDIIQNTKEEL